MPQTPNMPDAEFIELWKTHQSIAAVHKIVGGNLRTLQRRRVKLEAKYGLLLEAKNPQRRPPRPQTAYERKELGILNGQVIVFSDAHFFPNIRTTALDGLLWAIKEFKPSVIVCNGDALDGATISRHPPAGIGPKMPSIIAGRVVYGGEAIAPAFWWVNPH